MVRVVTTMMICLVNKWKQEMVRVVTTMMICLVNKWKQEMVRVVATMMICLVNKWKQEMLRVVTTMMICSTLFRLENFITFRGIFRNQSNIYIEAFFYGNSQQR